MLLKIKILNKKWIEPMGKIKFLNNMKQTVSFAFLLFALLACSSYEKSIPEKLRNFADDITTNPQKLRNLKGNFPDFYNPDCISKDLTDSITVDELVNFINLDFNFIKENYHFQYYTHQSKSYIQWIKTQRKCSCSIDSIDFLSLYMKKTEYQIELIFFQCDSTYKIFYINGLTPISM